MKHYIQLPSPQRYDEVMKYDLSKFEEESLIKPKRSHTAYQSYFKDLRNITYQYVITDNIVRLGWYALYEADDFTGTYNLISNINESNCNLKSLTVGLLDATRLMEGYDIRSGYQWIVNKLYDAIRNSIGMVENFENVYSLLDDYLESYSDDHEKPTKQDISNYYNRMEYDMRSAIRDMEVCLKLLAKSKKQAKKVQRDIRFMYSRADVSHLGHVHI